MKYNYIGFFDIPTLERAYRYADDKHIHKLELSEDKITALVNGSRDYDVTMTFEERRLKTATCNCPLENGKCKHAAAILIYLDEKQIEKMQKRSTQK